jgi:uncharacterized protein DUF3592
MDPMAHDALSAASQTPRQDRTGVLTLGGFFLLFCALVLGAGAGWQVFRQHLESTRWPAVAAQLSDCHVHTGYDSWHGRTRAFHSVECSFHYHAGDIPYVVKAKAGNTLVIVRGQVNLTRPQVTLSSLQQWVKRHPNGTVATIHYDPARPERISLVGLDDDITWQTTAGYARGAATFAVAGVALVLLGIHLRRTASSGTIPASV